MLTSSLLGLLLFAMGLLGFASFHFGTKTVNELADTIVQQTLRQTEMRVQNLVRTATDQNEINLKLTPPGRLTSANFEGLFDRLAPAFEVRKELSYLGLALDETGEYCMLERLADGSVRIREYVDGPDGKRVIR